MRTIYKKSKTFTFYAILMVIFVIAIGKSNAEEPSWLWATSAEGTGQNGVGSLANDASGNLYVVGSFISPTLELGTTTLINSGDYDVYLAKYSEEGDLVWARSFGGPSRDTGSGIATDASGNIYITGRFQSQTITFENYTLHSQGSGDIYFAKFDAGGNVLWAKSFGGIDWDYAYDMAIDYSGNLVIAGRFISPELHFDAIMLTNTDGNEDIFVVKFDPDGNSLWAKSLGGPGADYAWAVTTDVFGDVYVAGHFNSPELVFASTTLENSGGSDVLLLKYDSEGNELWAVSGSGEGNDRGRTVVTDLSGNVYFAGYSKSPVIKFGNISLINEGTTDSFILKYDADGNFQWSKSLNNQGLTAISQIISDAYGNVLMVGDFDGPSMHVGTTELLNAGGRDIFVAKLDSDGNPIWAKGAGGPGDDRGFAITMDSRDNIYIGGHFISSTLNFGTTTLQNEGDFDIFVARLDGGPVAAPRSLSATALSGSMIQLDWQANAANDQVLVAYSTDGVFGEPEPGIKYNYGFEIPGGGTALYFGQEENSFLHSGLDFLTTYHYRAWSFNVEYSNPQLAKATTLCADANALPFAEDFNAEIEMPVCWSLMGNVPSSRNWKTGSFANGLTHGTGNYAWVELSGSTVQVAVLVSPKFDFGGVENVEVSFKHRYNHGHANATFAFTTDDGNNWQTIESWDGNTGNATFGQQLAMVANQSNVQFGWILATRGTGPSRTVRSWSVDDVQISIGSAPVSFTIVASAGPGGAITPSGSIAVNAGSDQIFTMTPNTGFVISDVLVDNASIGPVNSYTFQSVSADHSIFVVFESATEDPCLISELPYLQDFNALAAIPECWASVNNTGNTGWAVGSFNGGLSGTTGNYAYFFYQGNQSRNADLISPSFDFSDYSNINLSFTHYHFSNRSTAGVYFSTDGGNNWVAIQTWNSSTANPASFSQDIPALAGQSNVKFRWNMDYPGGGPPSNSRSWSVDDILVSAVDNVNQSGNIALNLSEKASISGKIEMICYPNPVSEQLNISIDNLVEKGMLIIMDMHGRQVYLAEIENFQSIQSYQLNIGHWKPGSYIVRLIGENTMLNQLIMKQ